MEFKLGSLNYHSKSLSIITHTPSTRLTALGLKKKKKEKEKKIHTNLLRVQGGQGCYMCVVVVSHACVGGLWHLGACVMQLHDDHGDEAGTEGVALENASYMGCNNGVHCLVLPVTRKRKVNEITRLHRSAEGDKNQSKRFQFY